jgi:hypothetical protein
MKYGFRKVNSPQVYYAKCIGDEIVHVITFREEVSSLRSQIDIKELELRKNNNLDILRKCGFEI